MYHNISTAFVAFFPVLPNNMGSSTVINARYNNWPTKKKIFQISHIKNINNQNIKTIFIKKEIPIRKIFKLYALFNEIKKYFKNKNKKIILIEGASWIFYSLTIIILSKIFCKSVKIIYISHAVESEIRKKYSNFFIYFFTFFFEFLTLRLADVVTAVSNVDKKIFKKKYKISTQIFPNALDIKFLKNRKVKKSNYIIFCGSYNYKPNKEAIDTLNNEIMPIVYKKYPNLKLVITGGGFKANAFFPWLINKGIVSKKNLYNLIFNSLLTVIPLKFGTGTRIKILESLILGTIVISSKKGIEGISLKNMNPPFIYENNEKKIILLLDQIIKKQIKIKRKAIKDSFFYKDKYLMKSIIKKFFLKNAKLLNCENI